MAERLVPSLHLTVAFSKTPNSLVASLLALDVTLLTGQTTGAANYLVSFNDSYFL